MIYSAAFSSDLHKEAVEHLLRTPGQEDLSFALWYPSHGKDRTTALLHSLILPEEGERELHGNASFNSIYFEHALEIAIDAGAGIAFLHSHLGPGWQGMSEYDVTAEKRIAAAVKGATGLPLVGLTLGMDGAWSARFWEKVRPHVYERRWCQTVRVAGESLRVTYHDKQLPPPAFREELTRTISVWGPREQAHLARLRVGIVGAGSVGNIIAESVARMGIDHLRVLDFDTVEKLNLDRLLHAVPEDAQYHRSKIETLARALPKSATSASFKFDGMELSVAEEEGFRAILDCDVIFSCVDRPLARHVLNFIAYAHLIPVVDGGLMLRMKKDGSGIRSADWRAHVAAPTRRCLECLGQYNSGHVALDRSGRLDDPKYIEGLAEDHPLRRNENVFGFSMSAASFQILQFLSMVLAPNGRGNPGAQMYHFTTASLDTEEQWACNPQCIFPSYLARGDRTGMTVTSRHSQAEAARESRAALRRTIESKIQQAISKRMQRKFSIFGNFFKRS